MKEYNMRYPIKYITSFRLVRVILSEVNVRINFESIKDLFFDLDFNLD